MSDILFNIVITGSINMVFTLVALGFVDRLGRRSLMLAGCVGVRVCHFLLGLSHHFGRRGPPVLVCTLATIACYAMSLAPVRWLIVSEIFPNRIRCAVVSVSAQWIACCALTFTFSALNAGLGPGGDLRFYSSICVIGFPFVSRCLPETTGKTLEQIEREYAGEKRAPARAANGATAPVVSLGVLWWQLAAAPPAERERLARSSRRAPGSI